MGVPPNFPNNKDLQKKAITKLSAKENMERLSFFESDISVYEKLQQIRYEIRNDIMYTFKDTTAMRKFPVLCKTVFRLNCNGDFYDLNINWNPNTLASLDLLTIKNIDSIAVLNRDMAVVLYGTNGNCGVIILHSNDKQLKRNLRKVSHDE
ncbi:hypothetical protein [Kordia sp.]|uniref:hypothetical protein n=1 Tax=Kordia sp. TaxID=1965332 RepID=UPI0025BF378A|nr:hypothetical protein [Kordia sp.]MCH2196100.1 hypothetical protein [Kordia sp.]